MQRLSILLFILLVISCGNTTEPATTPEATEDPTPAEETDAAEASTSIVGLYTNGWHSQSYAVLVDESNGKWFATAAEWEGMMPPDHVFNYPDDIPFEQFEVFSVNTDDMTFTSDWGEGSFTDLGMVFSERESLDFSEEEEQAEGLLLYKNSPGLKMADLPGFYSGSTWHSQGYIVTIEEGDEGLVVAGAETEGGMPTPQDLTEYPEEFDFKTFTVFTLGEENMQFNSDWGTGRFQHGPNGISMIFDKKTGAFDPSLDQEDIQIRLYKYGEEGS